ncbi:membrane-anchored ubiquitin-fold protein 3-like isoform X1 [Carex rostrata]
MAEEEPIEVRFRLFDGTDIGPDKYDPSTTVTSLKETIIARWPPDKPNAPRAVEDLKLINAGRILENKWTLTESRVPVGDMPASIITMHVVVRPPSSDKRTDKEKEDSQRQGRCACTIL